MIKQQHVSSDHLSPISTLLLAAAATEAVNVPNGRFHEPNKSPRSPSKMQQLQQSSPVRMLLDFSTGHRPSAYGSQSTISINVPSNSDGTTVSKSSSSTTNKSNSPSMVSRHPHLASHLGCSSSSTSSLSTSNLRYSNPVNGSSRYPCITIPSYHAQNIVDTTSNKGSKVVVVVEETRRKEREEEGFKNQLTIEVPKDLSFHSSNHSSLEPLLTTCPSLSSTGHGLRHNFNHHKLTRSLSTSPSSSKNQHGDDVHVIDHPVRTSPYRHVLRSLSSDGYTNKSPNRQPSDGLISDEEETIANPIDILVDTLGLSRKKIRLHQGSPHNCTICRESLDDSFGIFTILLKPDPNDSTHPYFPCFKNCTSSPDRSGSPGNNNESSVSDVCLFCHHSLVHQWINYELSNHPSFVSPAVRSYDINEYICYVCGGICNRKGVTLLTVSDFPFLKHHPRPVGSLVVGHGSQVSACSTCHVSLRGQFFEFERLRLPLTSRGYNWIRQPVVQTSGNGIQTFSRSCAEQTTPSDNGNSLTPSSAHHHQVVSSSSATLRSSTPSTSQSIQHCHPTTTSYNNSSSTILGHHHLQKPQYYSGSRNDHLSVGCHEGGIDLSSNSSKYPSIRAPLVTNKMVKGSHKYSLPPEGTKVTRSMVSKLPSPTIVTTRTASKKQQLTLTNSSPSSALASTQSRQSKPFLVQFNQNETTQQRKPKKSSMITSASPVPSPSAATNVFNFNQQQQVIGNKLINNKKCNQSNNNNNSTQQSYIPFNPVNVQFNNNQSLSVVNHHNSTTNDNRVLNQDVNSNEKQTSFATALRKLAYLPVGNNQQTRPSEGSSSSTSSVSCYQQTSNNNNVILNRLLSNTPSSNGNNVRLAVSPSYQTITTNVSPSMSALSMDINQSTGPTRLGLSRNVSSSGIWRPQESIFSSSNLENTSSFASASSVADAKLNNKRKANENRNNASPKTPRGGNSKRLKVVPDETPKAKEVKSLMDARCERLKEFNEWKEQARLDSLIHGNTLSSVSDAQRLINNKVQQQQQQTLMSSTKEMSSVCSIKSDEPINVTLIEDTDDETEVSEDDLNEESYDQLDEEIFIFSPTPIDQEEEDDDDQAEDVCDKTGVCIKRFRKDKLINNDDIINSARKDIENLTKYDFLSGVSLIPKIKEFNPKFNRFLKERIFFETPLPLHYEYIDKLSSSSSSYDKLASYEISSSEVDTDYIPNEIICDQDKKSYFNDVLDLNFIGSSADKQKMNELYWFNHVDRLSRSSLDAKCLNNNLSLDAIKRWFSHLDANMNHYQTRDATPPTSKTLTPLPAVTNNDEEMPIDVINLTDDSSFDDLNEDANSLRRHLMEFKEKLVKLSNKSTKNKIEESVNNLLTCIETMFPKLD